MSYFLTNQKLEIGKEYSLDGDEASHILLSRRMKKGEKFNLQGKDEKRYKVEIKEIDRNSLKLVVLDEIPTPAEPKIDITLFQAVVNEKALDFILQKSTELGAHKIVLFNSANVAAKLSRDQFNKKLPRWQKIMQEAAKQCNRVRYSQLEFVDDVDRLHQISSDYDALILLDPSGQRFPQSKISPVRRSFSEGGNQKSKIAIIIGPEGGFTTEEVDKFKVLPNCVPVSLGSIILRAETAAIAGLAVISNMVF